MSEGSVQIVEKYDEALNQAESIKYKLSIQLSLDGFSFSIFNTESNKFLSLETISFGKSKTQKEYCNWLKDFITSHEWLNLEYNQVSVILEVNKTTLIPFPLFDGNEIETYVNFNFNPEEGNKLHHDKLTNLEAHNIYAYPNEVLTCLKENFPSLSFHCHASCLIESLIVKYKNAVQQKRTFVNVRKDYLDIVILDGKQLLYFNTFHYRTKEDFIYYVIFVIEQLNLNPEEVDLFLLGMIDQQSGMFDMIYKYVRNIQFLLPDDTKKYSYVFDEIPGHYYFNLLNISVCE